MSRLLDRPVQAAGPAIPTISELIAQGQVTQQQVDAVVAALSLSDVQSKATSRRRVLAEMGLYIGGVFVLLGVALLIGATATQMSQWLLGVVLLACAAALAGIAFATVAASHVAWFDLKLAKHSQLRRLASVLLTLAVGVLAGALGVFTYPSGCWRTACYNVSDTRTLLPLAAVGLLCFLLLWVIRVFASTPLSEIAWFGSLIATLALTYSVIVDHWEWLNQTPAVGQLLLALVGVTWAVLAVRTTLLRSRELGLALGMALALIGSAAVLSNVRPSEFGDMNNPDRYSWTGLVYWIPLAVLIIGSLIAYLRLTKWQFLAASGVGIVVAVIDFVTRYVRGSIVAIALVILMTGVLLAGLGAIGFRTSKKHRKASPPTGIAEAPPEVTPSETAPAEASSPKI
jgi:MFS family permease